MLGNELYVGAFKVLFRSYLGYFFSVLIDYVFFFYYARAKSDQLLKNIGRVNMEDKQVHRCCFLPYEFII